jgi:ABC-type nitrate/sulfonate/bicarbonate transport systems, periplasmic components
MHDLPSRRRFLLSSAISVAALSMPAVLRAKTPLQGLTFYGPPAGPSITLAYAVAEGSFSDIAGEVAFKTWRDPDELRAGLTSGTMKVVIMPSNAAANLYNRGLGVHMVNAMTLGLNYIMTKDPAIKTPADLKGRSITFPFRNDTPDILLRRVLAAADVPENSLKIVNAATPIEAVQLLLSGRAETAVLPEPAATMAEMRALQAGQEVYRAINIQEEWGKITGLGPVAPQAGLAVMRDFDEATPGVIEAIQSAIEATLPKVIANPMEAAKAAANALGMPAPILAKSIPHSALSADRASSLRPQFEAMYKAVADVEPRAIGGQLPDDGFYRL